MVKHLTTEIHSLMPQPVSQKLLRGKVDVTDQMQFKLVQTTQPARSAVRPKAVSTSKRLNANLKHLSSIGYDDSELFTRDSLIPVWMVSPSNDIRSKPAAQSSSIVIDDSLLLNLLKQIVDFEYNQTHSAVVVPQPLNQDMQQSTLSDQRDAVLGVLRSAIVAAAESTVSPIQVTSKEEVVDIASRPTLQPQVSSSVDTSKDSMSRLLLQATRLADLVSPRSFNAIVSASFQNMDVRREMQHVAQQIVWYVLHNSKSKAVFTEALATKVVCQAMLPKIQESEYGTAPIWFQQDMENGPPIAKILANTENLTSHKEYRM